jgi:hypothetical protein
MAWSNRGSDRRARMGVRILVSFCMALFATSTAAAQLSGGVSTSVYSQYLWRGRDYTLAGAPVALARATGYYSMPEIAAGWITDPSLQAELISLTPIARRDTPFQTALTDTLGVSVASSAAFWNNANQMGQIGIEIGVHMSLFYGALRATGPSYGMLRLEPFFAVNLPTLYGRPRWSAMIDLTPDQVGWRSGLEWFPEFAVPWGTVTGYVGAFRPHNYLKQKSPSFFERLFAGEIVPALGALIPSDLTIGAASLVTLTGSLSIQPEIELMIVPNRAQNPQQFVPAAALTLFYGAAGVAPEVHEGR